MMNNVTPMTSTNKPITLDSVLKELMVWRETKDQHKQVNIPDELWGKIFHLENEHPASKLRSLFGVSAAQYNGKQEKLGVKEKSVQSMPSADDPPSQAPFTFCKAGLPTGGQPANPKDYQVETTTMAVEFRRADGKIMIIHTTTNSFEAVIKAFWKLEVSA